MGGRESSGFMAPAESGENILVRCENGDYFADYDAARGIPRAPTFPKPLERTEEVETPGVASIEALAEFLDVDPAATSKAMPVVVGERPVLALIRGDDRLAEEKLVTALGAAYRPANDEEIRAVYGAGGGSLGPVGVTIDVVADEALREGQFVAGANRDGWHLRGVQAGRDYNPRFADYRQAMAGDDCSEGGFDVLLDDRDARAGEKFADADLIGCPFRVTVGRKAAEDGTVDLRERARGEDDAVKVGELVSAVRGKLS